jgi:hypothetical protein
MISSTVATDADALGRIQKGNHVALAGVLVQIAAFGLFTVVAGRFHFTSQRFADGSEKGNSVSPGEKTALPDCGGRKVRPNWQAILFVVNMSCAMILVSQLRSAMPWPVGSADSCRRSGLSTARSSSPWEREHM